MLLPTRNFPLYIFLLRNLVLSTHVKRTYQEAIPILYSNRTFVLGSGQRRFINARTLRFRKRIGRCRHVEWSFSPHLYPTVSNENSVGKELETQVDSPFKTSIPKNSCRLIHGEILKPNKSNSNTCFKLHMYDYRIDTKTAILFEH